MVRIRFSAKTKNEYKCLIGYNKITYDCKYYPSLKPQKITCIFRDYYPQFGYEKIYSHDLKKKEIILHQLEFDSLSKVPTVVHYMFKYVSEHLPNSQDKEDLLVFEKKLR